MSYLYIMDKMSIGKDIPWDEIIARLKRTSTPEQEARLEAWLASGSNASIYRELTGLWEGISRQAAYEPDVEKVGANSRPVRSVRQRKKHRNPDCRPDAPENCSVGPLRRPPQSV